MFEFFETASLSLFHSAYEAKLNGIISSSNSPGISKIGKGWCCGNSLDGLNFCVVGVCFFEIITSFAI